MKAAALSKSRVSVVIITFNEGRNIRDCLESVQWARELIVVDSWSTDKTIQLAREYTDKIFQRDWEGYSGQKNFGLSRAQEEWVLFLDADERISEPLALEIRQMLEVKNNPCQGYFIPRQSFYGRRWIRYGEWNPDLKLRLVRNVKVKWVGKVHERILLGGQVDFLKNVMYHYTYRDVRHHFEKMNRYSSLFAEEAFEKGQRANLSQIFFEPFLRFLHGYFFRQGFRDGLSGFLIAAIQAFEVCSRYTKLRRLERNFR